MDATIDGGPDLFSHLRPMGDTTSTEAGDGGALRLCDGRIVRFAAYGARNGRPVLALHGTPGSRLKFVGAHAIAAEKGLRLICPDRWGYGGTSLHPQPSIDAHAQDMMDLMDRLAVRSCALLAISGGGPYAVALAALAGSRISRMALVSPVGPIHLLRADELRACHRLFLRILPRVPGAATALFRLYRRMLLLAPVAAVSLASVASHSIDRATLSEPLVRRQLAQSFRTGLAQHAAGAVCDLKLFDQPWTSDPAAVNAETRLWLGTEDRTVPYAAVTRLAAAIPDARLTLLHGEGHFWAAHGHAEVFDWLAGSAS
ncbi:MAG: alpha/beta fold hydrolase [Hyphomicrobiaceae bacterium]